MNRSPIFPHQLPAKYRSHALDDLAIKASRLEEHMPRIGFGEMFRGTRRVHQNWIVSDLESDPLVSREGLCVPVEVSWRLQEITSWNIKFHAIYIGHEIDAGLAQPSYEDLLPRFSNMIVKEEAPIKFCGQEVRVLRVTDDTPLPASKSWLPDPALFGVLHLGDNLGAWYHIVSWRW